MVFDDSATRATAIGTANFSEGMVTYTKDDDAIQVYDGSNFVGVGSDSGLIHIETQTFSAVQSVIFSQDVFTAQYDNYLIVGNVKSASNPVVNLRFRNAGSSDSTGNYNSQFIAADSTSLSGVRYTNETSGRVCFIDSSTSNFVLNIFLPKKTELTMYRAVNTIRRGAGNTSLFQDFTGYINKTDSFDSLEFLTSVDIEGEYALYGYRR
jgi:hypothetical protein